MKKSKTLYVLVLILLMGIALVDHMVIQQEPKEIVVGKTQENPNTHFHFAFLPFNH